MKGPRLLISCAWLLHAAAWFFPVVNGVTLLKGLPGWEAFRYAFSAVWPIQGTKFETWYYAVLATVSAATTLLFIWFTIDDVAWVTFTMARVARLHGSLPLPSLTRTGMFSRGLIGQTSGFGTSSGGFLLPGWR